MCATASWGAHESFMHHIFVLKNGCDRGKYIIYLSLMHLTERVIAGYNVPNTHDRLVNLDPKDRPQARIELHDELKYTWECISIEP
jgi:hypothetical protein